MFDEIVFGVAYGVWTSILKKVSILAFRVEVSFGVTFEYWM